MNPNVRTTRSTSLALAMTGAFMVALFAGVGSVAAEALTEGAVVATTDNGDGTYDFIIGQDQSPADFSGVHIAGRGATFQRIVQKTLAEAYNEENTGATVTYGACGSSCGIRSFFGETRPLADTNEFNDPNDILGSNGPIGDKPNVCEAGHLGEDGVVCTHWTIWGSSDAPLKASDYEKAANYGGRALTFPYAFGTIAFVYNVPDAPDNLQITSEQIQGLMFGELDWADLGFPGTAAPRPVHRCDGSGTTFSWTDYLERGFTAETGSSKVQAAKVFDEVDGTLGRAIDPETGFPLSTRTGKADGSSVIKPGETLVEGSLCGGGNSGVSNVVKNVEGAFGYVELAQANLDGHKRAAIRNAAGNYVAPSLESGAEAVGGANPPQAWESYADFSVAWPTNAELPNAYVASAPAYMFVWGNPSDVNNGNANAGIDQWSDVWTCKEYSALKDYLRFIYDPNGGQALLGAITMSGVDASTRTKMLDAIDRFMNCGENAHTNVHIPDVTTQGFPYVGFDVELRGTETGDNEFESSAFRVTGGTINYIAASATDLGNLEGEYVALGGLTVVADIVGLEGRTVLFLDGDNNLVEGFVPADNDWAPAFPVLPTTAATALGQVIDGRIVLQDF